MEMDPDSDPDSFRFRMARDISHYSLKNTKDGCRLVAAYIEILFGDVENAQYARALLEVFWLRSAAALKSTTLCASLMLMIASMAESTIPSKRR
jgi:hypothetical protein